MEEKGPKIGEKTVEIEGSSFSGSLYSQIVSVTVTDVDVTLEFVFLNPRSNKGQVVARITLPRTSSEELAKTIMNTVLMHEKNKKGKRDD